MNDLQRGKVLYLDRRFASSLLSRPKPRRITCVSVLVDDPRGMADELVAIGFERVLRTWQANRLVVSGYLGYVLAACDPTLQKRTPNIWTSDIESFSLKGRLALQDVFVSFNHLINVRPNDGLSTPVFYVDRPIMCVAGETAKLTEVLPIMARRFRRSFHWHNLTDLVQAMQFLKAERAAKIN